MALQFRVEWSWIEELSLKSEGLECTNILAILMKVHVRVRIFRETKRGLQVAHRELPVMMRTACF